MFSFMYMPWFIARPNLLLRVLLRVGLRVRLRVRLRVGLQVGFRINFTPALERIKSA